MKFIDSHCHLNDKQFQFDLNDVIDRSIDSGVIAMICVGTDIKSSESAIKIAEANDCVFATCGVHPHDAENTESDYLKHLEDFSKHEKVLAVGEMGLDYHYNFSDPKIQKKVLSEQLEMAKSLNLPSIIHNRESDSDLIKIIDEIANYNAVVHCFSSDLEMAKKLLKLGLKLSFTGMVTFVKPLKSIIANIPLNNMMIETDSPYLAPVPYRGKRCEPSYVKTIAEGIASIQNKNVSEVAALTTKTAVNFFNIPIF